MTAAATGLFQSCLKERDRYCPPTDTATLLVSVAEKNYANVGEIPQAIPVDEGLSFRNYVNPLDVRYLPIGNPSATHLQRTLVPGPTEMNVALPAEALPGGQYEVFVTGNASPENYVAGDDYLLELHPGGTESNDIYIASGTVTYPLTASQTLSMNRTKGLLLLYYESLPDNIANIRLEATGVSKNVDSQLSYSGTTTVTKDIPRPADQTPGILTLLLAPTQNAASPHLTIHLTDSGDNNVRTLSNITLPITRNQITAFKLTYDPDQDVWEIRISIEGVWIQIHDLILD